MKKILFVLFVLAAVFTAGCITSSQIPPGCGGLQSDEECAASIASTSTPTEPTLVVKSAEVAATPMATESMPTTSKITTQWFPISDQDIPFLGTTIKMMMESRPDPAATGVYNVVIAEPNVLFPQGPNAINAKQVVIKARFKNKKTGEIFETGMIKIWPMGGQVPGWTKTVGSDADPNNLEWQADLSATSYSSK